MRNIVLIILDSVRKDYFDSHAKRLQQRADVSFERCYAPSSWSVPSHASIFTGKLPHEHDVHSYGFDYSSAGTTVFEELDNTSLCVSGNSAVAKKFGINRFFDECYAFEGNIEYSPRSMSFREIPNDHDGLHRYLTYLRLAYGKKKLIPSILNGLYIKINSLFAGRSIPRIGDFGADQLIRFSLEQVQETEEPFILFNNFNDAHFPMENFLRLDSSVEYGWPPTDFLGSSLRDTDPDSVSENRERFKRDLENYRELYAANIRYLDEQIDAYIDELQNCTDGETTVIVTADHGEELLLEGERDFGHLDFSTALLHVPFIVINCDGPDISELTTLLDTSQIIRSVNEEGIVPNVSRSVVPAERIGMVFGNEEDPEYWSRGVRTVYFDNERFEWDTLGRNSRLQVKTSMDRNREPAEIPEWARDEFSIDLDTYVEQQKSKFMDIGASEETKRRLEELGYKV